MGFSSVKCFTNRLLYSRHDKPLEVHTYGVCVEWWIQQFFYRICIATRFIATYIPVQFVRTGIATLQTASYPLDEHVHKPCRMNIKNLRRACMQKKNVARTFFSFLLLSFCFSNINSQFIN